MNLEGECVNQSLSGSLWTHLYLQEWAGTTKEVSDKTSALLTVYAQESREQKQTEGNPKLLRERSYL